MAAISAVFFAFGCVAACLLTSVNGIELSILPKQDPATEVATLVKNFVGNHTGAGTGNFFRFLVNGPRTNRWGVRRRASAVVESRM